MIKNFKRTLDDIGTSMTKNVLPNNNSLEYIMSGCGFARMNFTESFEDPVLLKWITDALSKLNNLEKHKFGLLYNAYAETKFGEKFKKYKDHVNSIHADSGGLQIVTRGAIITPKIKEQIYKNQANWSDIAMSFDEIPVITPTTGSIRGSTATRWFNIDEFELKARQTGLNLKEQIEFFIKEKTTARPLLIVQGNCIDTFCKWTEYVLQEIPKELQSYIGGVAISSGSLGNGTLEDIKKSFAVSQLPIDGIKHLHILGVGSISRMMPTLIFMQNGVYNNLHISYDSTTHSSGAHRGMYYAKGGNLDFPRDYTVTWNDMYNDINKTFDMGFSNVKEYHRAMNGPSKEYEKEFGSRNQLIKAYMGTILKSIHNFMIDVEQLNDSNSSIQDYIHDTKGNKIANIYRTLSSVKTLEDYNKWEVDVARHVPSKPVSAQGPSIENFY